MTEVAIPAVTAPRPAKNRAQGTQNSPMGSVLSVRNLWVNNGQNQPIVKGISFGLPKGTTLGIVGESGSGKTILLKSILGVLPDNMDVVSGSIDLFGIDILRLRDNSWRPLRGKRISAIFQDPGSYLNPSIPVGKQLAEVLRVRGRLSRRGARQEALAMLEKFHLHNPKQVYYQFPFELSGGMLQRVLMAIALCLKPEILIADEATTALDVTVQAELLDLLHVLKTELELSLILVSHDLAVVAQTADYVLVMKDGEVVEEGPTDQVLRSPKATYTQLLVKEHAHYGLDKFLVPATNHETQSQKELA